MTRHPSADPQDRVCDCWDDETCVRCDDRHGNDDDDYDDGRWNDE